MHQPLEDCEDQKIELEMTQNMLSYPEQLEETGDT